MAAIETANAMQEWSYKMPDMAYTRALRPIVTAQMQAPRGGVAAGSGVTDPASSVYTPLANFSYSAAIYGGYCAQLTAITGSGQSRDYSGMSLSVSVI